jgi:manganese-dependent ADP-ribose/CDP-alcohol diphosphatase
MRHALLSLLALAAVPATPASAKQPLFSIGAIADCQFADEPDAPPRLYSTATVKLAAAVDDLNGRKLSFVVHLGDFIDRDWASYYRLMPIAARLHHPWHFVLGNHDFAVDDAHKAAVPARLGMPARYYSFVEHGWMFIVTDGNGLSSYAWSQGSPELAHSMDLHSRLYADRPLWDGGIDEAQMTWLDQQLADADRRGLRAVVMSHFPVWPENPHNLWNAHEVLALLERHNSVQLWLDGHNHEGNYGIRSGIHFLNLKAMLDTEETAYAMLSFYRDRIEVRGVGKQPSMTLKLKGI